MKANCCQGTAMQKNKKEKNNGKEISTEYHC